jgi:hypothetical protein
MAPFEREQIELVIALMAAKQDTLDRLLRKRGHYWNGKTPWPKHEAIKFILNDFQVEAMRSPHDRSATTLAALKEFGVYPRMA